MAAVALSVLILPSFALGASSPSGELCSVLLQTRTDQSSLAELQSSLAELDDFESSLEDLQTATQELSTHRSSSRRRTSSFQLTSAQDEQLDSASEEGASLLRNTTASNATTASASNTTLGILSNLTSNLTSSAKEIAHHIEVSWDRVCTAAAAVVGIQILLFTLLCLGGQELFGEYRFTVLRIGCVYTSLPLLIYFFYETGALGQTFTAAVPFLVLLAIVGTLVIPLVIECILDLHQGWKELFDDLNSVIRIQKKIASHLHIDAGDEDGDGDIDCVDYAHAFRKKHLPC